MAIHSWVSGKKCIEMGAPHCEIITDLQSCRSLWEANQEEALPFGDWELRAYGAETSEITPYFLRHKELETLLPLGLSGDGVVFFGGKIYSERNGFIGPSGGEAELLELLISSDRNFRLLSWEIDPLGLKFDLVADFEVPYNQFWIADPFPDLESYVSSRLQTKYLKEFHYLQRKFDYTDVSPRDEQECTELIDMFIDFTVQSFAKRNARSVYQDELARRIILKTCLKAYEENALKLTMLSYKSEPSGLAVFIDKKSAKRATYLLNLYASSPSDVSNGVTCAVIQYACRSGKPVDGLRGAFTLKKKFGFRPEPSFALVRDPSWIVRPQSDLSPAEIASLYGRPFGRDN